MVEELMSETQSSGVERLRLEGYRCGLVVDSVNGTIETATVEETATVMMRWTNEGGTLVASWTIEAGAARDFLRDAMLGAYLQVGAKLVLFLQRKIDALKVEAEIRRRIFRQ
jgi:hypothetical protein